MRRDPLRWLAAAVTLAFLATSCFGSASGNPAEKFANLPASEVEPPPALDPKRTGLPGLVLATNGPSWHRLLEARDVKGAVVLFVEPVGPSDGVGIARGDVLVKANGQEVHNHQRALAALKTRPDQDVEMEFVRKDGEKRTVTVKAREPRVRSIRHYVNPLLQANPKDAVLLYLRAQDLLGEPVPRIFDAERALKIDRKFADALTLRSSLLFDNRPVDRVRGGQLVNAALAGWRRALRFEKENIITLTSRSTALTELKKPTDGRKDAAKAISIDPTLPRGYYALAVAERALKRPERAAGPARAAVELDPFNVVYWKLLASIFVQLKRKGDCRKTTVAFVPFLEETGFEREARSLSRTCR